MELQDLRPALLHLQHEVVVIALRLVDPDHVVEEEIPAVAGRQALMGETGPADQYGPQLPDLGIDTGLVHGPPPFNTRSAPGRGTSRACARPLPRRAARRRSTGSRGRA